MFAFNATANAFASAFFALASPEMSPSDVLVWCLHSMDVAGSVQLFYLHPSELFLNHVPVAMVYLLLSVLPTLYVLYALLQHRDMHHFDRFICTWSWIVALIVLGHHSSMVFLHPQLFAVVKWLSILYLFVFYVTMPVYWCVEKLLERPDTATGGGGGVNVTVVAEVPRGEGRDEGWRIVAERLDYNYKKQARAQKALAKLMKVYENSKRNNPHRFRIGSSYERQLLECELFEQGIDMIVLEMRLRMEFHPTLLSTLVQESWEEAAFDEVYNEWVEELDEEEDDVPDEGVVVSRGVASTGATGGKEEDVPDEEVVVPREVASTGAAGGEEEDDVPDEGVVVPRGVASMGATGGKEEDVPDEEVVVPREVASTGAAGGEEEDDVPDEGVVVPRGVASMGATGGKEEDVPDEEVVVPGEVASTGATGEGEEDDVPDEEVVFPVPGEEEEESEVPGEGFVVPGEEVDLVHEVQALPRKRKRGKTEAEALRSDLGRYWEPSSNRGMVLRRSCRTRRPPVRYTP